jgi:hypothetical protein
MMTTREGACGVNIPDLKGAANMEPQSETILRLEASSRARAATTTVGQ